MQTLAPGLFKEPTLALRGSYCSLQTNRVRVTASEAVLCVFEAGGLNEDIEGISWCRETHHGKGIRQD